MIKDGIFPLFRKGWGGGGGEGVNEIENLPLICTTTTEQVKHQDFKDGNPF